MILVSSSEARSSGTLCALFVVTWANHARMFAEAWDTYQGIPPRFFQVFEACVEKRWKLNTPCQNRLFSSKHAHQNKTSAWKLARLILTTVLHMCLYDLWPLRLGLLHYGIKIFFVHIHDILFHHIHQRNQAVSSKKASSGTGGDSVAALEATPGDWQPVNGHMTMYWRHWQQNRGIEEEIHHSTGAELKSELKPNQTDDQNAGEENFMMQLKITGGAASLHADEEKVWNMPQNSERSRPLY